MISKNREFEALFGIPSCAVQRKCVIMPQVPAAVAQAIGLSGFSAGRLYRAAQMAGATVINTRVGAGFVGDAVLYLGQTRCAEVLLFGSCGLCASSRKLRIGSLVSPGKVTGFESFSAMLKGRAGKPVSCGRASFARKALFAVSGDIADVSCATVASLKCETAYLPEFRKLGISVVDMEASAFFTAADHSGIPAAALFYISDRIGKAPFYLPLKSGNAERLRAGQLAGAAIVSKWALAPGTGT